MLCLVCIWTKFLTRQTIALLFAQHSTLQYSSLNVVSHCASPAYLACCMAFPVKREAIAVWDIENTRVPTKLLTRCNDIVKWLLEDIQAQCPNTTVLKIYVAGTFDNYPVPIKTALCTHPRVQLLYSVGKVVKGGEADDALKRVILDFHSNQLAAGKQAVIALLSGDADYNNEVDAARIANHKVLLYHSTAVAQTLQGNVDYSEPWQNFLARKSGEQPDTLEDVGFVVRQTTSQATMGSASHHVSRCPQTPPVNLQPIPLQYCSNSRQHNKQYQQTNTFQGKRQSGIDSQRTPTMQLPMQSAADESSSTKPVRFSGQAMQTGTNLQDALQSAAQQPPAMQHNGQRQGSANFQALPQLGPEKAFSQPTSQRGTKQALLSAPSLQSTQSFSTVEADAASQSTHIANSKPDLRRSGPTDSSANPCSDGRSVVISGFKKGTPGFEAKERALVVCKPLGPVTASWVRKGRTGCWFVIIQFEEAAAADMMIKQGCTRYSKNGSLAVRWYMSDAPAATSVHAKPQQAAVSTSPLLIHPPPAGLLQQSQMMKTMHKQSELVSPDQAASNLPAMELCPSSYIKSYNGFRQLKHATSIRLAVGVLLLIGYFALLAAGF